MAHQKLAFRERPAVTVAAWVRVEQGGLAEARIAVGSVGPVAVRATAAESIMLAGGSVDDVGEAAAEESGAVADANGSEAYKRQLVRVLVGRALAEAQERAG
jgi:carbon-monoxide dehydrogenase medium subunit